MKKVLLITGLCSTGIASAAVTTNLSGFVKAAYTSTQNISSAQAHKPWNAINSDAKTGIDDEGKNVFTVTQSRWVLTANNGSKTSAKFGFDLDNTQGSGVGSMSNTRIRQAAITYKPTENDTITMGKKWTIFNGGQNPFTYGMTRVSFKAGNSGFFVDGVDYNHKFGNTSVALELSNSGDADVNVVSTPTTTLNVSHKIGEHKIGLAYTSANLKYKTVTDTDKDSKASGTKVYWSGKYSDLQVRMEYLMGSNLGSIQTGTFAKATAATDDEIKETAYYVSLKYAQPTWSVFGGYGVDSYNKEEEAGDGNISKNALMILGYDRVLDEGLTTFIEYNAFTTSYYNATDDKSKDTNASSVELGLFYKF